MEMKRESKEKHKKPSSAAFRSSLAAFGGF
jgi:hypothetical protein